MNVFLEDKQQPLTTKRKFVIWVTLFTLVPSLAWAYGKHEYKHSDQRRMMMPVNLALPAQLPTIWEF